MPLQIDVGFGDAVVPPAEEMPYPTLLDFPAPQIKAYSRETVIAEKFHAMVSLGIANSRMKDFYDIYSLAKSCEFSGNTVCSAIKATFEHRSTPIPSDTPIALTEEFTQDSTKVSQWRAFTTGGSVKTAYIDLDEVIELLRQFIPAELRNRLIRTAAFQTPEFYKAQAMRLPTFGKPRIISCAEDLSKHIALPRGCVDETIDLMQSLGIRVEMQDERYVGEPISKQFQGELSPDQLKAASALMSSDTGVLAASTAFGKTVVAINMIAQRKVNTLILVHRQQLLEQWVARLSTFLDIDPKQIGRIGGGKHKPTGIIDVALLQSLCKKGVVDDIVGNYGHLIVDECHHISAVSFEQVTRAYKGRYVLGLSATPARKDGHHPIIFMQCGPIRYRDNARNQAFQRPFEHKLILRKTGFILPFELSKKKDPPIQDIYAAIIADPRRNALILDDVIAAIEEGRSPVVITERTDHLEMLADELAKAVKHVIVLRGGMGARQGKAVLENLAAIPDSEERVIVATGRYLGEGFDDARLDTLFLTMPISWKGTLVQYAGRLHRLHTAKKEVRIYDYADLNVQILARMHEKRLRGYRAIGYV